MKYRLEDLNSEQFEELSSEICIKILGEGFVNFASGKDGGRDGKFTGRANSLPSEKKPFEGKFVIQAKHIMSSCASCSDSQFKSILKREIPKIKKLYENGELEHYFLLTNRKLTGGCEVEIQEQIKKDVPQIKSISIWGKERIHLFLDNNKYLHDKFGLNRPRSPMDIRPEDLIEVVEQFRKQIPKKSNIDTQSREKDFLYTNMEKKNAINGLSDEYYKHIRQDSEKYFQEIGDFLKNPRNEKYRNLYNETAYDFKGVIISRRGDYENFDNILEDIFSKSYLSSNKKLLKVFIHFMYFNCDIGDKEG